MARGAGESGMARGALVRAGLFVMILGGLLAYWSPEPLDYSGPKLALMAAGLALAWLGAANASQTIIDRHVMAFAAAALASALASVDMPQSFLGDYAIPLGGLLELVLYVVAFSLGASLDDSDAAFMRPILVLGGTAMALVCVLQRCGLGPSFIGRPGSTAGSPVAAGACLAMVLPLALSQAAEETLLRWLPAPLIAVGLILTGSRSAWVAAVVAVAFWMAGSGRLRGMKAKAGAAAAAVLAAAASFVVGVWRPQSDVERLVIWRGGLEALKDHPWLGYGPDAFSIALRGHRTLESLAQMHTSRGLRTEAHNDLLQVAVTQGLVGLAPYVALQVAFVAAAWRLRRADPDRWSSAMAALLAAAVVAKFNPVAVQAVVIAALLAGTVVAAHDGTARNDVRRAIFRFLAFILAAAFGSLWLADLAMGRFNRAAKAGDLAQARASVDAAVSLAPLRLEYALADCDLRIAEAKQAPTPALAQAAASGLLSTARRAAAWHQGNPLAHVVYGTSLLFGSSILGPQLLPAAKGELELASALDPTNPYPIQRRILLAQIAKDKEGYERASGELARISAVAPVPPADR